MADNPVPPDEDYYFEVKILDEGNSRYVGQVPFRTVLASAS
jgi:hypothetical protein